MNPEFELRLRGSLRDLARIISLVVVLIGALVLIGWLFDVPVLKSMDPGQVSTKVNAAIGFVLAGIALGLIAGGKTGKGTRLAIRVCAGIVVLLGLLSLAESVFGWDLGIDQLLFQDPGDGGTIAPGRMAPNAAVSFALIGSALVLLAREERSGRLVAQVLTLAASLISLLAFIGYAYNTEQLYGLGVHTQMALPTAVALFLLSLGALFAHPDEGMMGIASSDSAGGMIIRLLTPAVAILLPLMGWLMLTGQEAGLYAVDVGVSLLVLAGILVFGMLIAFNAWSLHQVDLRRRHAEENVSRLAAIVDSSDDAIIGKTLDGTIVSWNSGAERLYGFTAEEVQGQPVEIIVPPDRPDELPQIMERLKRGERVQHYETIRKSKDGRLIDVSVTASPIKDVLGRLTGASTIARDITEKKRAEAMLAKQARDLQNTVAELEQFAYVASHDLQEPLRMVASYVQLLARRYQGKLDADADEFIGFAVDGSKRMQQLIDDLLSYSRVGTRGRPFEPTDCEKVLNEVLTNLQVAIEESGATVTHDTLPTVIGDATQLGQLFQNLIGNALKFRGGEQPRVHIGAELKNEEWRFSVQDNGIGIDPEFSDRIFLIFQRLHNRREYPGTGIGLAICKKIAERHGGQIWIESEPGKGTTFYFTIPMKRARI